MSDWQETLERTRGWLDRLNHRALVKALEQPVQPPRERQWGIDRGDVMHTYRRDPQTVRAMVHNAKTQGWSAIRAEGSPKFRRFSWLLGRAEGLDVAGYEPTKADERLLERLLQKRNQLVKQPAPKLERGPGRGRGKGL